MAGDNEHWARHRTNNFAGHTAEQESLYTRVSVCGPDNQIGSFLCSNVQNMLCCWPFANEDFHSTWSLSYGEQLVAQLIQLGLGKVVGMIPKRLC
jgi:hypothetical protein